MAKTIDISSLKIIKKVEFIAIDTSEKNHKFYNVLPL